MSADLAVTLLAMQGAGQDQAIKDAIMNTPDSGSALRTQTANPVANTKFNQSLALDNFRNYQATLRA
ncbi:MAG: hypothetical protein LBP22_06865 [Deltaproteobacteria bacterium]|nr:hypothetical protein [Deltaproteobacteria bacterium]